jgi:hypothetical protein
MKLGNVYNIKSYVDFDKSAVKQGFAKKAVFPEKFVRELPSFSDAYTGTVLGRNLTHVSPTILEKKYPELAFVNSGITADNTGGYAPQIQTLRVLAQGSFAEASNRSVNEGKISLSAEDTFISVSDRSIESSWTKSDIETAKLQNINLTERYVSGVNELYMRELDISGFVGLNGSEGLLNNSAFVSGSSSAASGLTAQQQYDELAELISAQHDGVLNTPEYMANRVTMPTSVFNLLQYNMLNTAGSTKSVLLALKDNFPGVTFNASARCNSVAGTSRTVAYSTNENAMKFRLPVPLQLGELVKVGSFSWKTDYMYRVAGLDVLEKTSGQLLTGF